ncbi:MAG TPA: hypothetical protein PK869_03955 [Candidatus Hydrogenedentes bacterium]|nr:hypothetical protein [Candidatus Hydrogenedentota bacterium]
MRQSLRFLAMRALPFVIALVSAEADGVRVATFQADVTPPIGSPLCSGAVMPVRGVDDPLTARGIVILPEGQDPIVLCAVDYTGIANESYDQWRMALSKAARTNVNRVAVHCLHQHDAPELDQTAENLLAAHNMSGVLFNVAFAEEALTRTVAAMTESLHDPKPVTHVGFGKAEVIDVASNRRVLGPDGKVKWIRWSATKDPEARAQPVGTIDPLVRALSFWNEDAPVAVLTYYTTHPQSYYGAGQVTWDFPGIARQISERTVPEAAWIHFNGASGNVTAGKFNDGNPVNRLALAQRLSEGMKQAWETTTKAPLSAGNIVWRTEDVMLPLRAEISEEHERAILADANADPGQRRRASNELAWIERCKAGNKVALSMLRVGEVSVLHMPGELFVEYQLAAQAMRPASPVCMAAYGEYGMGYIGLTESYPQGGYETGLYVSRTAPEVEPVLMNAMRKLLE